jgi:hypothetical protein
MIEIEQRQLESLQRLAHFLHFAFVGSGEKEAHAD